MRRLGALNGVGCIETRRSDGWEHCEALRMLKTWQRAYAQLELLASLGIATTLLRCGLPPSNGTFVKLNGESASISAHNSCQNI